MAEMINIPTLKHILALARSENVKYLRLGEMEVTFFEENKDTDLSGAVTSDPSASMPTDEDMIFYSSGVTDQPNDKPRE
jgi:hypothetical protein